MTDLVLLDAWCSEAACTAAKSLALTERLHERRDQSDDDSHGHGHPHRVEKSQVANAAVKVIVLGSIEADDSLRPEHLSSHRAVGASRRFSSSATLLTGSGNGGRGDCGCGCG